MNVQELFDTPDDFRQVKLSVGGDGKAYYGQHPQFEISSSHAFPGMVVLNIPDSVAEHFRQQGRRQLQSELRHLLNTPRA